MFNVFARIDEVFMSIDKEDVVIRFMYKKMSGDMLGFYRQKVLDDKSDLTVEDKSFLSGLNTQQKNQLMDFLEIFFNETFASFFVKIEGEKVDEKDKIDLFFRGENLKFIDDAVYSYLEEVYPKMFK